MTMSLDFSKWKAEQIKQIKHYERLKKEEDLKNDPLQDRFQNQPGPGINWVIQRNGHPTK